MDRQKLARLLERARLAKQRARERSKAWYAADARIERYARLLYPHPIDMDAALDAHRED